MIDVFGGRGCPLVNPMSPFRREGNTASSPPQKEVGRRMRIIMKTLRGSALLSVMLLASVASTGAIHHVTQSGTSFIPANLTIARTDTVIWTWTSLSHTVTNGTGSTDPNVGTLFDVPLNSLNPTFKYVFGTAGTFPYFCRPHELFGMKGTITVTPLTGVEGQTTPAAIMLGQNFPNPFNPSTRITYSLARAGIVLLKIYDLEGRLVETLAEGTRTAGSHEVAWDGRDTTGNAVSSGVYFCKLTASGRSEIRKMVLLR